MGRIYWLRAQLPWENLSCFDAPNWGQPITRELFEVHLLDNPERRRAQLRRIKEHSFN